MDLKNIRKFLIDTCFEIAGCVIASVGINSFAIPALFPMSGFSGIALIFYRLFGVPVGLVTVLLNIPLALVCFKLIGRNFFCRSIRAMVIFSLAIDLLAPYLPAYEGSRLVSAICTGVLCGIGYGIIYLRNSSTGGTDFVIMAVKAKFQHLNLGNILFVNDSLIIIAGGIIFRDFEGVIMGLIINYINAAVVDKMLYGLNSGKLAMIVTDYSTEMNECIDRVCGRGTTVIPARGGYKGDPKNVILCACSAKEMFSVENAVKELDPNAFTVILESNEVLGEGFKAIRIAEPEKNA